MDGEQPKAYIVLSQAAQSKIGSDLSKSKAKGTEIADFVKAKTIRYKHLTAGVEFIDAIPKNPVSLPFTYNIDWLMPTLAPASVWKASSSDSKRQGKHKGQAVDGTKAHVHFPRSVDLVIVQKQFRCMFCLARHPFFSCDA